LRGTLARVCVFDFRVRKSSWSLTSGARQVFDLPTSLMSKPFSGLRPENLVVRRYGKSKTCRAPKGQRPSTQPSAKRGTCRAPEVKDKKDFPHSKTKDPRPSRDKRLYKSLHRLTDSLRRSPQIWRIRLRWNETARPHRVRHGASSPRISDRLNEAVLIIQRRYE